MTHPSGQRRLALEIALISFAILVQELALIRWIPSQVRVVAYFPNVMLMSAFLGLGLGCIRSRAAMPSWFWPGSMVLLCVTAIGMSRIAFTQESASDHLWLLYFDLDRPVVVDDIRVPILLLFVLATATFVPPGQYLAARILESTRRGATLSGYACDLAGSLSGVLVFAALSFLGTPPVVWFAVSVLVVAALFSSGSLRRLAALTAAGIVVMVLVTVSTRDADFSPYYEISIGSRDTLSGPVVLTNGSLHQYPAPLTSPANHPRLTEDDRLLQIGYPIPYAALRRPPDRVLVLGAGTGNDVAVALARGASFVDAVEIDPVMTELGRRMHPSDPYSDPRVTIHQVDARSFLQSTERRYDLVVFGTLDSMTRLSALASVRLDNFVYTREGLEAAKRVLAPGGGIAMYFMVSQGYIADRLVALHLDVFGRPPAVHSRNYVMFNFVVLSGPAYDHLPRALRAGAESTLADVIRPTDDWPFLYLADRRMPRVYIDLIAAIALAAIAAVFGVSRRMREDVVTGRVDLEMFALGAAFLLLETRAVTQMSLVWGATWITSAVVFASILLMLLLATRLMERRPFGSGASLSGLLFTLALTFALPASSLLGGSWLATLVGSILFVGAPIFFASTLFAVRFASRASTDSALGWNLLGAVFGGLLEFTSMIAGLRALVLMAIALYAVAATAARFGDLRRQDEERPVGLGHGAD